MDQRSSRRAQNRSCVPGFRVVNRGTARAGGRACRCPAVPLLRVGAGSAGDGGTTGSPELHRPPARPAAATAAHPPGAGGHAAPRLTAGTFLPQESFAGGEKRPRRGGPAAKKKSDLGSRSLVLEAGTFLCSTPYATGTEKRPRERENRNVPGKEKARRLPTLPIPCGISTIGHAGLNFRIRNGIGCGPRGMITGQTWSSEL